MKYNFDNSSDRLNTYATKWQILEDNNLENQVVPMWIADMDFDVCKEVIDEIKNRLEKPIFGYTNVQDGLYDAFCNWYNRRLNYAIAKETILLTTSVMTTYKAIINLYSNVNDKVIIPYPNYHRFKEYVNLNGRIPLYTEMKLVSGRYKIDFYDLESKIDENTKIFILCNPSNPLGFVFNQEELLEIANFCQKHNLIIFNDEIHLDFILGNTSFTPFALINDYTRNNTISTLSISKTFNLAGMKISAAVVINDDKRKEIKDYINKVGLGSINTFAYLAMEIAYLKGEDWFEQVLEYLKNNRKYAYEFIEAKMPHICTYKTEATYFLWLDLSITNLKNQELEETLLKEAKVMPSMGVEFGEGYDSYVRLNLATKFDNIVTVFNELEKFLKKYG